MAWNVDEVAEAANTGAASLTATFATAPEQDDLIVATVFTRGSTLTNPAGFATDIEVVNTTEDDRLRICSKIAGAAEGAAVTFTDLGGGTTLGIYEISGAVAALDQVASTGRTAAVTSVSSGTTGTLSRTDEIAIAMVALRDVNDAGAAVDSGFTLQNSPTDTFDLSTGLDAYKIVAATTGVGCTFSWATGSLVIAAIATYMSAAVPTYNPLANESYCRTLNPKLQNRGLIPS